MDNDDLRRGQPSCMPHSLRTASPSPSSPLTPFSYSPTVISPSPVIRTAAKF
ncbi:hypothetical protein KSP39_PZI024187 [Platanthera zijinensis]|uniref:Uncharacterized protein n=1 Tax=Platanthera zijinensis TaxID=2320716 RepID=A0AAP0AT38_9ASPA